jgi:hypothetical protein
VQTQGAKSLRAFREIHSPRRRTLRHGFGMTVVCALFPPFLSICFNYKWKNVGATSGRPQGIRNENGRPPHARFMAFALIIYEKL